MRIRKRYHLQKKKLKGLYDQLGDYSKLIPPKATIELLETDNHDIILINSEPRIMMIDNTPFPTLKGALKTDITSKYVVVDMGAVKYMTKGADVMSPGITDADPTIMRNELVIIIDETHRKPLAIGRSLITGSEMILNTKGKAVKNLHFIGDEMWNLEI